MFSVLFPQLFGERELTFTFAICYRPSVCRLSVTLVHPTQPVEIFGNVSTPFWYFGHQMISTKNFTEIIPGLYSRPGLYLRPGLYSRKYGTYQGRQKRIWEGSGVRQKVRGAGAKPGRRTLERKVSQKQAIFCKLYNSDAIWKKAKQKQTRNVGQCPT